ncbi:orf20 [Lactobacillus phage LP65]|uniref:Orf20 n=1 Tax=Lactobacillus phage LP65 TaxID=2892344 RepID=Q5ULU4_9CAUD|nr:hypothetical protein LP65_gp020 [Lactobacillus phage LP65]AAV35840.1 orf20 [Lactobacillus phage LP65]
MSADTCAYLNTDLTSLLEYLTNKYNLNAENLSNITAGHGDYRPVYDDSIRDEATGELKNQLLSYNNSSIIQRMQYIYHGFVSIPKLDDGRAMFVLESSLDSDCAVKRFKPLWDGAKGCIYVSLSCYGSSVEAIKDLAKEFGGPIDEDDCDDEGYYYVSPVKDKGNH